jgi:hypothetical protein
VIDEEDCHNDPDHGPAVLGTNKCAGCVQDMERKGFKARANGRFVNKTTGVTIHPSGHVSIGATMNPRMIALLSGDIEVDDLDDDELARGMCRNEDGRWPRRQPNLVPKAMYDKMTAELFRRSDERLKEGLVDAVESLVRMIGDPEVDASTRLKATTWMFERLRGKTPDVVEIKQDKPYQMVLTHIHRGPKPDLEPEPEPIEAEVVEEPKAIVKAKRPTRGKRPPR